MQTVKPGTYLEFQNSGKSLKDLVKIHLMQKLLQLPQDLRSFTIQNCMLTGGCFASLSQNEKVNDFDLYLKDLSKMIELTKLLEQYKTEVTSQESEYSEAFVDGKIITSRAITLGNKLQYIIMMDYQTAKQNMDYVHCTVSYDIHQNVLWYSELQDYSIKNKKLIVNNPLSISDKRSKKFQDRGWTI